jgi:hypothetical protein
MSKRSLRICKTAPRKNSQMELRYLPRKTRRIKVDHKKMIRLMIRTQLTKLIAYMIL